MRIRLINKTHLDNDCLKELIKRIATHKGMVKQNIWVEFVPARRLFVSGFGWYNERRKISDKIWYRQIRIKIPMPFKQGYSGSDGKTFYKEIDLLLDEDREEKRIRLYQIIEHELDHTLGLKHKDMMPSKEINVGYLKDFKLVKQGKQAKPEKPERNLVLERYQKAKAKQKEYEGKAKRYNKLLKKWAKKVKYYESKGQI